MTAARYPNGTELRAAAELRVVGRQITGYAAVFGVQAQIGSFSESIRAGAFRATLADPEIDPVMLVDHDPGRMLGRRSSGTLRLAEDARGLNFSCDVPDTQVGRDILVMIERGDLKGCSFAFRAIDEAWPAPDRRELRAVALHEISAIHVAAAYAQTSIAARSRVDPVTPYVLRRRRWLAASR